VLVGRVAQLAIRRSLFRRDVYSLSEDVLDTHVANPRTCVLPKAEQWGVKRRSSLEKECHFSPKKRLFVDKTLIALTKTRNN
jgi:hypothetical protein